MFVLLPFHHLIYILPHHQMYLFQQLNSYHSSLVIYLKFLKEPPALFWLLSQKSLIALLVFFLS
ncbi:hypothetical protein [Clostridium perfringens str. 13]|uniref:Uncharacterized protein n=1 Tax=Clostridium perfringens (strain 13 / Type A) TaxID=195102 RepID=Q8XIK0_CLOPE|nr:hypothetical protein [Clostridium perfringens str. 13]